ncbi:type IV pilus modification protein PilV [Cupriavidus sp. AcVe19-6a]|uniref:type IV pilus modification protein PilV n=1 Tax=Cupriavidus sp. AcVe19-6a TaxID=2821358 RepID=UPI001AE8E798|nr:type IV pilus modification protein PilV [Cupriavidus sp. AcVe19-6a]MBP0635026.1 type IV pilus modification protein PilV [Cupriavidus sp. AcVe19-6a]
MLIPARRTHRHQHGFSLLEVLVAIVILSFGLLGTAGLLAKVYLAEIESYQRTQATLLLQDMAERIGANRALAPNYVTANAIGTGDTQAASCAGVAAGAARDICEWSNALKGAAEQKSAVNVGAMLGARGCITQLQAPDPTPGTCTPGIYQVAVAWQGVHHTAASAIGCAQGQYGNDDAYRRVIATQVSIGLPACF